MKTNRLLASLLTMAALALPAQAMLIESFNFTPGAAIPDGGGGLGLSEIETIASTITTIDAITVELQISRAAGNLGGFNGDLFVSLSSLNGGFSVLMNRVGRGEPGIPVPNLTGYSGGGVDVEFDDVAANGDIHVYETVPLGAFTTPTTQLTGTWAPDGRNTNPNLATTSDPRNALLGSFVGIDPSTDWTLVVQDFAGGTALILDEWTVNIISNVGGPSGAGGVPEPGTLATMLVVLTALPLIRRARRRNTAES